ncbi:MAG: peptidoglycan recognition protein family protein [Prevotella sp.]|nr:peptidoglycan recognition protein family protein [Prevotella sp.]
MMKRKILIISLFVVTACAVFMFLHNSEDQDGNLAEDSLPRHYEVRYHPTPNIDHEKRNEVKGVILHHTAEPTVERSLEVLTSTERKVGTHVVIDTDGTRFVMCKPTDVTFHAGLSILNGEESCNNFTIGIEFQGNTLEKPLTDDQIQSAIDYLLPLISDYDIPVGNIVTHEMVRKAYMEKYPNKRCSPKVDITQKEYLRFMSKLKAALNQ